jgi:hypothetical protein
MGIVRILLTRKLALTMNGVDVSRLKIGETVDLPEEQAEMMIDEGWAEPAPVPVVNIVQRKSLRSALHN